MDIFGEHHDPESASGKDNGYWEKVKQLETL
jgi:hypothetical protein